MWSFIGSRALSTRPLGKLPCLHRRELLFKSGFEFEKEFHIFGLAFKKSLAGLLNFGKLVESSQDKNLEPSVLVSRFQIWELRAELVVKKEKPHFWFENNFWRPTNWLSYSIDERLR